MEIIYNRLLSKLKLCAIIKRKVKLFKPMGYRLRRDLTLFSKGYFFKIIFYRSAVTLPMFSSAITTQNATVSNLKAGVTYTY